MRRGAPSGRPFHAKLTDIAQQAGLHAPTIYGAEGSSDYIVETIGCGAVFFVGGLRRSSVRRLLGAECLS